MVQDPMSAELRAAIEAGRVGNVERLLRAGEKVNGIGDQGLRPLHIAVNANRIDVARILLNLGADVDAKNRDGSTPLYLLARRGKAPLAPLAGVLLEAGADPRVKTGRTSWTVLHWAAFHNDFELVKLLLQRGADSNEQLNKDRWTPLHLTRTVDVTSALVEAGANIEVVDRKGLTPLIISISPSGSHPQSKIALYVAYLISKGADLDSQATNGATALHLAVGHDLDTVAGLLIKAGADPNVVEAGVGTPLHRAVGRGNHDLTVALLEAGADPNSGEGPDHCTPVHLAAIYGRVEIAKALVQAGGRLDVQDRHGKTPLDRARDNEVKRVLTTRGTGPKPGP